MGHIERCAVLLHLVDGTSDRIATDYETIIGEIEAYEADLAGKPRVTVLNKVDALNEEERLKAFGRINKGSEWSYPVYVWGGLVKVSQMFCAILEARLMMIVCVIILL